MVKKTKVKRTNVKKKHFLGLKDEDFSRENFIEGGIIRPLILMVAFFSFVAALLLLVFGAQMENYTYYKWGGSFVIFSFVFNMYSIYQSLGDDPSIFKKFNLGFKLTLLILEVVIINWIISIVHIIFS